jgi:hypothetical protein
VGEDPTTQQEIHSHCQLTVPKETIDTSQGKHFRVRLSPGEVTEMVGKDDQGGKSTDSVDPFQTVLSTDDDGGRTDNPLSGSRGRGFFFDGRTGGG